MPNVLHEPLMARLPASVAGRRIAAVAATIGRDIDLGLLRRAVDVDESDLVEALQAMEANRIIERVGDGSTPYRFRHELVREVAYEAQLPSVRREVHALIADALAGDATPDATVDWVVLADHQERAGRLLPAAEGYANAADAARRRGALDEATRHLDRALEVVAALPDGSGRRNREVELLLQRGFLAVSTQGNASPQAALDYERGLDLAMRYGSRHGVYSSLISLWGYYATRGDLGRARQVLEGFESVATGDYARLQTENQAGFAILDWFGGHFGSALEGLEAAATAARERPPEQRVNAEWALPNDPCASIFTHLATARFVCGDPLGAAQAFDAAFRYAHELTFPYGPFSTLYAESYVAWIALERGDLADAQANMLGSRVRAEAHGFDFFLVPAATVEARLAATRAASAGEPVEVLSNHARALDDLTSMWVMLGTELLMPQLITTAAEAWARAGNLDAARQRLDDATALAGSTGLHFYESETRRVRASCEDDPAATEAGLLGAFDLAEDQGATAFALRIARDLHVIDRAAHRSRLAEVVDRFAPDASYPELDAARAALRP